MFFPLHDKDRRHWFVVHINSVNKCVEVYDSLKDIENNDYYMKYVSQLKRWCQHYDFNANDFSTKINENTQFLKQKDAKSCGLYSSLFMYCAINNFFSNSSTEWDSIVSSFRQWLIDMLDAIASGSKTFYRAVYA